LEAREQKRAAKAERSCFQKSADPPVAGTDGGLVFEKARGVPAPPLQTCRSYGRRLSWYGGVPVVPVPPQSNEPVVSEPPPLTQLSIPLAMLLETSESAARAAREGQQVARDVESTIGTGWRERVPHGQKIGAIYD